MEKNSKPRKEVVIFAGRGFTGVFISGFIEDSRKIERHWYSERFQGISLGTLFACVLSKNSK